MLCVNILFILANFKSLTAKHVKSHIDCESGNVFNGVFCKKCHRVEFHSHIIILHSEKNS